MMVQELRENSNGTALAGLGCIGYVLSSMYTSGFEVALVKTVCRVGEGLESRW